MITSWNFYRFLLIKNNSWIQVDLRIVHLPRESSRDGESINESRVSQVSSVTSYRSILIWTPNYRRGAVESTQSNSLEPLWSITRAPRISVRGCVHGRAWTCVCVYMYVCARARARVCVCVCVCVRACVCACVCIYMCVYVYTLVDFILGVCHHPCTRRYYAFWTHASITFPLTIACSSPIVNFVLLEICTMTWTSLPQVRATKIHHRHES